MSRPQSPPTTMVTNAATRALTVGRAVGPRFGSAVGPRSGGGNDFSGSGTRES
jgi:hypothetical protein